MTPLPRLQHAQVGDNVTIHSERKSHVVVNKDRFYAYFEDDSKACLSTVLDDTNMVFGDGRGWHVKEKK